MPQDVHQQGAGTTPAEDRGQQAPGGTPAQRQSAVGSASPDIRDIELLAWWLDSRFRIPGTRIRFGLDSLLGLVPGVGDAATTLPAAWMLYRAHQLGVPRSMLARMGWNVVMDLALGSIPVVGDLFDIGFKANRRNVELLRQHLGQPARTGFRDPVQGSF